MTARIRVTRGDLVESEHRVHAVVVGAEGAELTLGDASLPTTLRSVAKLFQALPLVEEGVADALPLSDAELAVCCASHNSEPRHVEAARSILSRVGLDPSALACGPHRPMDCAAARALDDAGVEPGAIHNNCSGKHAGMLALAVHNGWEPEGYHLPDHPVQRRMIREIARWSGLPTASIPTGVDGCGIPCYGLPLERLAGAFRRFVASESEAPGRLLDAIAREPFMIGGSRRLCTRLPQVTRGRIVAKIGAEGVYGAVDRGAGLGIAVKVEDGARRAVEPALIGVLEALGALSARELRELDDHRAPAVRNTRDEVVGRIEFQAASPAPGASRGTRWDPGLDELVRLSAALAGGSEADVDDVLREAAVSSHPLEVEEAILQSYLFLGFPVALNAFAAWRRVSGREAPEAGEAVVDPEERGERTCRRVYGGAYEALRVNVARLKPELDRWMVVEGYGKVLSRPGLDLLRRECCISAILAVRGLPVQLRSHMRGALRCGATPEDLDRILDLVEPWTSPSVLSEARTVRDTVVSAAEE